MDDKKLKEGYLDFDEYIRQGEPEQQEKASIWQTAIGLQAVDGLKTSDYLKETARKHIEGDIDIDQARELIRTYYQSKTLREPDDDEKQEADKVSANITKILSAKTFDFSSNGIISLHRRIFEGVFSHAGKIRDYNITKKEWVLEGDTVNYLNWEDLRRALDYDLAEERKFSYRGISQDAMVAHISSFVSGIWQIHAFGEGNTRTTAVFTILYLRHIGFEVNNDMFAQHSWYFRNALVRANYKNAVKGIDYSPIYLERFFRNLLLGEKWDLRNRYLHISATKEWSVQPNLTGDTRQVPDKYPTSMPDIERVVVALGEQEKSLKELMAAAGLNDREHFTSHYLNPSMDAGYICRLYPNSPKHPAQKYLLTPKGVAHYKELIK